MQLKANAIQCITAMKASPIFQHNPTKVINYISFHSNLLYKHIYNIAKRQDLSDHQVEPWPKRLSISKTRQQRYKHIYMTFFKSRWCRLGLRPPRIEERVNHIMFHLCYSLWRQSQIKNYTFTS